MNALRLESTCAWIAFAALILGALSGNTGDFKVRELPYDLDSPVLAMELLRTPADMAKIVGTDEHNDRAAMARLVRIDYGFIAAYSLLFLLTGRLLYFRGSRATGIMVAVFGCGAGALDVMENLRILQVLQGGADTPRMFSLAKWGLVSVALGTLARVYIPGNCYRCVVSSATSRQSFLWVRRYQRSAG